MNDQLLTFLLAALAASLPVVRAFVKAKLTPERLANVADIARVAVRAADKLSEDLGGFLHEADSAGAAKLAFAHDFVYDGSHRLGLRLSETEILAYIHQALAEYELVK